jgi:hypothetical protein
MRVGNSDHERWDNSPSHTEAPKKIKNEYLEDERHAKKISNIVRVAVWIGVLIAALVVWFRFYR